MTRCHLCEEPLREAPYVGVSSRGDRYAPRVACLRCGLVQRFPMPTYSELDLHYTTGQYEDTHGLMPIAIGKVLYRPEDPDYPDALARMAQHRVDWMTKIASLVPGMRLLEVGPGDGLTAAAAQDRGFDVATKRFEDSFPDGTFDCVYAFHVLEHVPQPLRMLEQMRDRLTPRGALILEVPNIYQPAAPLERWHYQWEHLYDFSPDTLIQTLQVAGFDPIEVRDEPHRIKAFARPNTSGSRDYPGTDKGGEYVRGYLDAVRMLQSH